MQLSEKEISDLSPFLFTIAYKMTKSVMDAEDILQEVFYEYSKAPAPMASQRSYFAKSVINRSINLLEKKKRVEYPGVDLPEPLVNQKYEFVSDVDISFGLLILLQKLSPLERAVFVLKDTFDYGYEELSEILEISQDYCRQLYHRARERLKDPKKKYLTTDERKKEFAAAFAKAWMGKQDDLLSFLKNDITIYADGGGKALAAGHPLSGLQLCGKFLYTVHYKRRHEKLKLEPAVVNGMPAIIYRHRTTNAVDTVALFEVNEGLVQEVYFVRNPDKLQHV